MEKLECLTSCLNVFLEDPPEAHQTLQLLLLQLLVFSLLTLETQTTRKLQFLLPPATYDCCVPTCTGLFHMPTELL